MGLNIIVVGAGIGGLTAAIALRRGGHKVLVLEKDDAKREVGFAISMPPNSTRVLGELGLDFKKARMTRWNGLDLVKCDEDPVRWIPTRDVDAEKTYGAPFLCAHRVDLHESLMELATGPGDGFSVEVRGGAIVESYDPVDVSVTLQHGEVLTANLLVAADGVRSKARSYILDEAKPATLSMLHSIRFVVPTKTLVENEKTKDLFARGTERAGVYFSSTQKEGVFRSPCRDNTLQNFGVYDMKESYRDENESKWITPATRQMALDVLNDFHDSIKEIVRLADDDDMFLWKVADRDPLPHFQSDKLVLIGDACHPMQPHHGQGATQAIEDAGVLGVVMKDVNNAKDIPARLQLWEKLRKPRVDVVQLLSRSEGMDLILSNETKAKIRQIISEDELPELTRPVAFNWFFRYDCLTIAKNVVAEQFDK